MAVTRSRKAAAIQKTPSRPKRSLHPPKKSRKGRKDNTPLDVTPNIRTRAEHPEDYPDLDFHHTFGSFLTRKNPISRTVNAEIAKYWGLLSETPSLLQHQTHRIGERYRGAFRQFFTSDPISLHGHVSDASNVALLTSLISHLVCASKNEKKLSSSEADASDGHSEENAFEGHSEENPSEDHSEEDASEGPGIEFFSDEAKENPRIAILEGSYGAGYGCLAYDAIIRTVRPLANGPRPFIIKTDIARRIDAQVERAKNDGCVALIAEIVRAEDGKPINERVWGSILAACNKHDLILIVDEALTAIRCGAPFAYQLPQYSTHGFPDLVLFGKAVRTNGIAVEWRGINIQKLGIKDRPQAILEWQERVTEMAQIADLLISWGTMVLARKERWPQRAQQIGRLLRDILAADGVRRAEIGGLHSLIYIKPRDVKRLSSPVMGAKAEEHIRWLPVLDEVMASEEELRAKVFGRTSIPHREQVNALRFIVLLGICVMTLPVNVRASSTSDSQSMGFPPELLPPINESGPAVGHLELPLDPGQATDFEVRFLNGRIGAGPPKGGQLITSILENMMISWKNTDNAPLRQKVTFRNRPFESIQHTIQPALLSETTPLTPLKVGLVYCWMMKGVLQQQPWPGEITASIYKRGPAARPLGLPLGIVHVENKPLAGAVVSPKNSTGPEFSSTADENVTMVMFVIKWAPTARVIDTIPGVVGDVHFRTDIDPMLECNLTITKYRGALPWRNVAESLLDLSVRAARADRWEYEERAGVMSHGMEVVTTACGVRPPVSFGGREVGDDGVAVTHVY
ncbi:hypothetical protein G7Y79_00009g026060 [Physcia stellaris]|nr:hypothetical protein G7Y79_00009g026060 [Physcia stellaris]